MRNSCGVSLGSVGSEAVEGVERDSGSTGPLVAILSDTSVVVRTVGLVNLKMVLLVKVAAVCAIRSGEKRGFRGRRKFIR